MASTSAISAVDDCIKERLDGASIDDVDGLVTDPITQEFMRNPVFIAGQIWESNSISSLRVNVISSGHNHWVHPLMRELISVEIKEELDDDNFTATFARATMHSVLHGMNCRLPSGDADEDA
jgi:hypothetical protein